MRTVSGRTDHVVIVGAGLGGLSAALHLVGAGRRVTIIEREHFPGGRAGLMQRDGYRFDTGPTVFTMPELLAEAFAGAGEQMSDWVRFTTLDPAYRAYYPDGSTLDVIANPARMAAEIERVIGPAEAGGYLRFVDYTRRLWELEKTDFIDRNFDTPRDLMTANLLRLMGMGAFGRLSGVVGKYFKDPRTQRIFSFQAMYAGLAPQRALAIYAVIAYLDSVTGVYFPEGGMHAVPVAMAAAAQKNGAEIRYGTTVSKVETSAGRATAVITSDGERIAADTVIINADIPGAYGLFPGQGPGRPLRFSPSCVVLHVGSFQGYRSIAHHNIHFGKLWRRTFDEVIRQGKLMSDPSLLVTNPSHTDPSVAPPGKHTYYVLAPAPNLVAGKGLDWTGSLTKSYTDDLLRTLEERGYTGFRDGIEVLETVTPATWAASGLAAGTPFAAAHTFLQTGPFRPGNLHPSLSNVVFAGSGTQPGVGVPMVLISGKLAAARVTGN
jgi:phytoene desaturase